MSYILNSVNLASEYGFIPGQHTGSNLALSGFLDMPARLGKCFHNWGASHGIEPYTSANEIRFGGRDISLKGWIMGESKEDCMNNFTKLTSLINSFSSLVPLSCKWGVFQAYVNAPIVGELHGGSGKCGLELTIPLREPSVNLSGIYPATTPNNEIGIDGITFESLGGVLTSLQGDRWNRPAPKSVEFTAYQSEGYRIGKTEAPKLALRLFIKQNSYTEFKAKIHGLYALLSAPGERNLIVKKDLHRRVFACEGFKVSGIRSTGNGFFGFVDIQLIQAGLASIPYYLADNLGNIVTDKFNNKILIKCQ